MNKLSPGITSWPVPRCSAEPKLIDIPRDSLTSALMRTTLKLMLLLLPCLFSIATLSAAPAYVTGNAVGCTAISCTASLTGTNHGDLIVLVVFVLNSTSVTSVADTQGNTFTPLLGPTSWGGASHSYVERLYYAKNIAGGADNITVTLSASKYLEVHAFDYSGLDTSSPLDVSAAPATGTGTTGTSKSLTTTNANDLLFAFFHSDGDVNNAAGPGYTLRPDGLGEDQIVSSTGTYTATESFSGSADYVGYFVAFKAASSGGAGSPAYVTGNAVGCTAISCTASLTGTNHGDLIVLVVFVLNSTSVTSVADTQGNTFTPLLGPTTWGGASHSYVERLYYAKNIAGGADNITVTLSASKYLELHAFDYSGLDTSSPVDISAAPATGSGTSGTSKSLTTTNANDLLFAFFHSDGDVNNAAGLGYTLRPDGLGEDQNVSSTGTYTATESFSGSADYVGYFVAFKAASSGGGGTCAQKLAIGNFELCGEVYNDVSGGTSVTVNYSPSPGNAIIAWATWCFNSPCNSSTSGITATIGDNVNATESCFSASPHSPFITDANGGAQGSGDFQQHYVWFCPSIPSGVTSFTMTPNNPDLRDLQLNITEWNAGSLANSCSPLSACFENVDNFGQAGNSTGGTTATITTSGPTVNANDLVFAVTEVPCCSFTASPGAGYTGITVAPSETPGMVSEAMAVSTAGIQTATTTWTGGSTDWFGVIVPIIGASTNANAAASGIRRLNQAPESGGSATNGADFTVPLPSMPSQAEVLATIEKVNDYWMANARPGNADWAQAVYFDGDLAAYDATGQEKYLSAAQSWASEHHYSLEGGNDTTYANYQAAGQVYIRLYELDKNSSYISGITQSIDAMVNSTVDNEWTWIDAINMSMPDFAELGAIYDRTTDYTKMYDLYSYTKYSLGLFDPVKSLWWENSADAHTPTYWSRGNGWVFAAHAKVLSVLPTSDPHYAEYLATFKSMAAALAACQQPGGYWNSDLGGTDDAGPESSGTSLFLYGIAWGLNSGILDQATYLPVVENAWNFLANTAVQSSGLVGYVQPRGNAPGPTTAITTEDFGVGAFLLAARQMQLLAH